ncbi:MAG TPA: DUF402 domain-containing protein [Longimicrobiales bacterium]|nr:DUF402 domain-containing protein [Longimicrobiales bacterium]
MGAEGGERTRRKAELVRIHYHRPPDREQVFTQEVIHRGDDVVVTFLPSTPLARPMVRGERTVLENGSPVVWFTFPGARHDVGRFHDAHGTFTGLYANVLTPVRFEGPGRWHTTDLFLDIWVGRDGEAVLLDEDELEDARARGWVDRATAEDARAEARRILALHAAGAWPPPVVAAWTLERVRASRV